MGFEAEDVIAEDGSVFFGGAGPRAEAGSDNDRREAVIEVLLGSRWESKRDALFADERFGKAWRHLALEVARAIAAFAAEDERFSGARIVDAVRRGGRGHRFDFVVIFDNGTLTWEAKLELKQGESLSAYPQFLQMYAKPGVVVAENTPTYPEHLYDKYIVEIEEIAGVTAPQRSDYVKWVVGQTYSKHGLFEELYRSKKQNKSARKGLADSTIDEYLRLLVAGGDGAINWARIESDFHGQLEKLFLMWDPNRERLAIEVFSETQLALNGKFRLKENGYGLATSLVLGNEAGTKIELLLRWKNNALILGPAWQMKVVNTAW